MIKIYDNSKASPSIDELRKFGILFGFILSALFGLLLPYLFDKSIPGWPWIISAVFIVLSLVFPRGLTVAYIPWMKFGAVAGWINTRIILGFLFFVFITPFGLVVRLLGNDLLSLRLDANKDTYRVPKLPQPNKHMENPY